MSSVIKKNKLFFILCAVFAVLCGAHALLFAKGQMVITLYQLRTPSLTFFLRYYTHIGDGAMFALVSILILVFVKIRWGILSLLSFALSGLLSQFLKRVVFGDLPRPLTFFENTQSIQAIEGFQNAYIYSFPSGHTTTAFAMFGLLAFFGTQKTTTAILFFVLAATIGISRIYLAQHFAEDVAAGCLLGLFCSTLLFSFLEEKRAGFFKAPALDLPLLKLKK